MFPDRRATFRSDDTVEREANIVRRWGGVCFHSQFNIVDLITGPLRNNLPFCLNVDFSDPRLRDDVAFVTFALKEKSATLHVRHSIWCLAKAGQDEANFILAHELGHLKMHRLDALGFSNTGISVLAGLQEEERAEPQADKFADRLLVRESLIVGFNNAEEIADYFNVPIACAKRRFNLFTDKERRRTRIYQGDACTKCFNFTLIRNGIYLKCDTCGTTSGCS